MCKDLKKNRVLGIVVKMKFGPRALCNRSIIYKTSDVTINSWLNKRMKRTEFIPFALLLEMKLLKLLTITKMILLTTL